MGSILDLLNFLIVRLTTVFSGIGQVFVTTALLLAVLYGIEIVKIGWHRSSLRRLITIGHSATIDLVSSVMVLSNLAMLAGTVLSFGLIYVITSHLKSSLGLRLLPHDSHPLISYLLFIVILDFLNYWAHRLMHRSKRLWHVHKFHHAATDMTMLTALRDHPLERAMVHGFNAVPTAMLGVPPEQYLVAQLLLQALGFLKHSNFDSNWGWVGRWLIQSPRAHRLHHSDRHEHFDYNFASIFQFWDVLFGTALQSNDSEAITIGLPEPVRSEGPIRAILTTSKDFYASLRPGR